MSNEYTYGVYQDENRHTCIKLKEDDKHVWFVPMAAGELAQARMTSREFAHTYKVMTEYPVRRAAEMYLGSPVPQVVAPEVREHLEHILADPAYAYDSSQFKTQPRKEVTMATAKKTPAPAKKAAAKKTVAPAAKKTSKATATDDKSYKIGDDSGVKRGFISEFVGIAREMGKTFTRDALVGHKKLAAVEEAKRLRYFYYCTGHGIFAEA